MYLPCFQLHTIAAYYPDNPTAQEQESMKAFLHGLGRFYPCKFCGSHFVDEMEEDPPK